MNEDHPQSTEPQNPPVAPTQTLTDEEVNSKKILCGILAILLGALGVHKFVLGYTTAGIIMVVCYVLGFVGGCVLILPYFLSFAVWVIGVIEGILYLTKSNAEFRATYIDGKKEWF